MVFLGILIILCGSFIWVCTIRVSVAFSGCRSVGLSVLFFILFLTILFSIMISRCWSCSSRSSIAVSCGLFVCSAFRMFFSSVRLFGLSVGVIFRREVSGVAAGGCFIFLCCGMRRFRREWRFLVKRRDLEVGFWVEGLVVLFDILSDLESCFNFLSVFFFSKSEGKNIFLSRIW